MSITTTTYQALVKTGGLHLITPHHPRRNTRLWIHVRDSKAIGSRYNFFCVCVEIRRPTRRSSRRNLLSNRPGSIPHISDLTSARHLSLLPFITLSVPFRTACSTLVSTFCTGTKQLWPTEVEVRHFVIGLAHDPLPLFAINTDRHDHGGRQRSMALPPCAKNRSSHSSGCGRCLHMAGSQLHLNGFVTGKTFQRTGMISSDVLYKRYSIGAMDDAPFSTTNMAVVVYSMLGP